MNRNRATKGTSTKEIFVKGNQYSRRFHYKSCVCSKQREREGEVEEFGESIKILYFISPLLYTILAKLQEPPQQQQQQQPTDYSIPPQREYERYPPVPQQREQQEPEQRSFVCILFFPLMFDFLTIAFTDKSTRLFC